MADLICLNCGWSGDSSELHCSDEDSESDKSVEDTKFDLCPDCGGTDFEEEEEEG